MANLVVNGDFETGLTGWNKYGLGVTDTIDEYLTAPHAGDACCKFYKNIDKAILSGPELYRWVDDVAENKRYTVSAWVKVLDDGTTVDSGSINIRLQGYDTDKVWLSQNDERAYFHFLDPAITHNNDWYQISYVTQPMPTGTVYGLIELFACGDFAGTVFFDDVTVEEYAIPRHTFSVTTPSKGQWYPGIYSGVIKVDGKIEANDGSAALNTLTTWATIHYGETLVQTLDAADVPETGLVSYTFTDWLQATTGEYTITVTVAVKPVPTI